MDEREELVKETEKLRQEQLPLEMGGGGTETRNINELRMFSVSEINDESIGILCIPSKVSKLHLVTRM